MPDWPAEHAALAGADRDRALSAPDLERFAVAAAMLGRDDEVVALRERAIELYLASGERSAALACGFWLGFQLQTGGASARASGWLERLRALAAGSDDPQVAVLVDQSRAAALMYAGDAAGALALFERSAHRAGLGHDVNHYVLARLGQGRCLQALGRDVESRAVLDEVMVHVAARRVQPQVVGLAYCSMIELCRGWYDIARAREWTEALTGWVDEQQGMVPYRGACLVHRAEFLQLRGEWAAAVSQADEACRRLALISAHAAGPAHYRLGELARLRGDIDGAERAFERAAAAGHEVQPGLARLRLAQARPEAALGGLDRAIAERRDPRTAPELLSARVEVCLVRGDLAGATETLHRLTGSVGDDATPYVRAMVDFAVGSVRCAGGSWSEALPRLRAAGEAWAALDARYEAAVARLALGRCCTALGDEDAGAMETAAARTALVALGVDAVVDDCPLTARELEVLRILATGATNRSIASSLVLSEKTVARHVSNIFTKLEVGSRSAATARAFERHWA